MSDLVSSNLRLALGELRLSYHQALARRAGREIPPDSELRRLIANEPDDAQLIQLMLQPRMTLLQRVGLSHIRWMSLPFRKWR